MAHRPAVPAALALTFGILAHPLLPCHLPAWTALIALLALVAIALRHRPWLCSGCLLPALFLAGTALAQLQTCCYPANHIAAFTTPEPRLAEVELLITQPPRILSSDGAMPRQSTTASVLQLRTWQGWRPACGTITLRLNHPHPHLALGQRLRAVGLLQRPSQAMNPGQFDWADYYQRQRILAMLQIGPIENITILQQETISPLACLRQQVRQWLAAGFAPHQALDHALLRALLVGDSDPQLRDIQDQFLQTGTSHHLSISGMHIAILGGFVYMLCRLMRCRPRFSAIIVILFVILYGSIALPSPPVLRSVLLCVGMGIGVLLGRSLDPIQLLAATVFAMLVCQPLDLYDAGFQLSFGTVLGLALFVRPLLAAVEQLRDRDLVVAESLVPPQGAAALWHGIRRPLLDPLACGLVAWTVSMPIIAVHFHQLNPWAIPAGIVLGIPVLLALIGGLLKVIMTLLLPGFSWLWATLAAWPIATMRHTLAALARLPGSDVILPPPPLWLVAVFYALLCLPLIAKRPILRLGGPAAALLLAVAMPLLTMPKPDPAVRLTSFSVGAGSCTLIQLPGGQNHLIDCGSDTISDLYRQCLKPAMRHLNVRRIEAIYLTHANRDHFSAAAQVVEAYDVQRVYVSPAFLARAAQEISAQSLLKLLDRLHRPPLILHRPQRLELEPGITLEALWPDKDRDLDDNNGSLVLRLNCRGQSILFPGDIQQLAERELSADPKAIHADVLLAPHHGSAEPTTADFVRAVDPHLILSSNDRTLTRKQRTFEQIIASRPLYRTHRHGALTIQIDPAGKLQLLPFIAP